MAGRGVDIERANHGFGLKQVPKRFMHFLVLRAVILLGILFGLPKAQCQNAIVLFVWRKTVSSTKPFCFFRIGRTLSLMVSASCLFFPGLVVSSTMLYGPDR